MTRYSVYFRSSLFFALVTLLSPTISSAGNINALELRDGNLTLSASQTSLIDIAQELALLSGIPITTIGDSVKLVDVDIVDEPFAKAIGKISPNHLLVRKSVNEVDVILEVIFMLRDDYNDSGNFQENLPSGEPVQEITETPEPTYQEQVPTVETTESSTSEQIQTTDRVLSQ